MYPAVWHAGSSSSARRLRRQARLRADRPQQVDPRPEPARRRGWSGPNSKSSTAARDEQRTLRHLGHRRMMRPGPPAPLDIPDMPRSTARAAERSTIAAVQDIALVLVIVLIVVVIWRGPKTLPLLGRAFGQGVREARREVDEIKGDGENAHAAAARRLTADTARAPRLWAADRPAPS